MYQTPIDCTTIQKWLTKCADDCRTANYISAHSKDGPKCNVCIEKSGSCNHMQCSKCKYIRMCLRDWKTHGSEYYECSHYKENLDIVNQRANKPRQGKPSKSTYSTLRGGKTTRKACS
ncbi:E3 ubiquitin-protein ligase ARIH2 [Plecturocebus cupreus]